MVYVNIYKSFLTGQNKQNMCIGIVNYQPEAPLSDYLL